MGNFFKRTISFFLGMIFMLVTIVGGVAGGAYWAFKNLTLDHVVEENNLGTLGSWTIEEWYATIVSASANPEELTLKTLEDNGFDLNATFAQMGVDLETADPKDVKALKDISLITLFGGDFTGVSLGALLPFIPNNQETGKPYIFSEGARQHLRTYSLGDVLSVDPFTQKPRIYSVIRQLPIGALLPDAYAEELVSNKYVYTSQDRGLNLFANVKLSVLTDLAEGTPFDLPTLLIDGDLKELGDKEIREIIASFGATDDETYQSSYDSLSALGDMKLKEMYNYDEENDTYVFDVESLLGAFTVGSLMGATLCTQNDECKVHDDPSLCDGGLYDNEKNPLTVAGIEGDVMKNIVNTPIMSLLGGGFSFETLVSGVYLGKAFGYETVAHSGYCELDCETEHDHTFYWVDGEGNFVGELFNQLSNVTLTSVMQGNLDIDGIINGVKIGEIFGYVYDEVDGRWESEDGTPVPNSTVDEKVLYGLYGKSITDLSSGMDLSSLVSDVYLGECLGYVMGEKADYCAEGCSLEHTHEYYWVDGEGNFVGEVLNQLANATLGDMLEGNLDINGVLEDTQVGAMLGYVYDEVDLRWEHEDGTPVPNSTVEERILYNLYDKTVLDLSSGIDMNSLMGDIYVGEAFGYKIIEKSGYCNADCALEHDHNFYWVDGDDKFVGELHAQLSNAKLADLISGTFNFESVINTLKVGEVFGYVYDEVDARWEHEDGTPVPSETLSEKVLYGLYSHTLEDLAENFDLAELLQDVYLGELLGYTLDGGVWYNGTTPVDPFYEALSNIEVSSLMDGTVDIKVAIGDVYVGDLMGYEHDGSVWKDGEGHVLGEVQSTLAETQLSDIFNGVDFSDKISGLPLSSVVDVSGNKILSFLGDTKIGELDSKIDELKIEDVLTFDSSNKVLFALKGTKVNNLPSAINDLEIGKMMGYVYDEDDSRWEDAYGNPVKGIENKLAGLKVSELSNGGINDLTFVVSDVLDETALSNGVFKLIDYSGYASVGEIPVSELSTAMTNGMKSSAYCDLVDAGVITAIDNEATLDKLFMLKKNGDAPAFTTTSQAHDYWTGLTVTDLMNETVELIDGYLPS